MKTREGLNPVALVARPQKMRYALVERFGFGGVQRQPAAETLGIISSVPSGSKAGGEFQRLILGLFPLVDA